MLERNKSRPSSGGEEGMTDAQYKGMLLDQLQDWQEMLDLIKQGEFTKATEKAEKELAAINEKLKF